MSFHWKCKSCHHEWDGNSEASKCSWCSEEGKKLSENPPFPVKDIVLKLMEKKNGR